MKRELICPISKARLALDVLDIFKTECVRKIEELHDNLTSAYVHFDSIGKSGCNFIDDFMDDADEEFFSCCREIKSLKFQLDFCSMILDCMAQCYIDFISDVLKED